MKFLFCLLFSLPAFSFAKDIQMSYSFGPVTVGETKSLSWGLRAKTTDLHFKEITLSGDEYSYKTNCPAVLPAQQRCVIEIQFAPKSQGPHQALLVVDLYGEKFLITILGEGL